MTLVNFEHWFIPDLKDKTGNSLAFDYPTSKVLCVGRNYIEHAKELNNPVPETPLFFLKPNSNLCELGETLVLPKLPSNCHYETELALLIGETIERNSAPEPGEKIAGVGLALDLTLRDLQQELKAAGKPWEKSKAFDLSCPVTSFQKVEPTLDFNRLEFELSINQNLVQKASPQQMIFSIRQLLEAASQFFTLYPGDILLTGTPAGVGELQEADKLNLRLVNDEWQSLVSYEESQHG